jgi:hypothetical protein
MVQGLRSAQLVVTHYLILTVVQNNLRFGHESRVHVPCAAIRPGGHDLGVSERFRFFRPSIHVADETLRLPS